MRARRQREGRFLFEDRWNVDQVPCILVEGDERTYSDAGEECVWISGAGSGDEGKRFCTIQVTSRAPACGVRRNRNMR